MDATIWDQILERIETKVNQHSFYTWFKPTSLVDDSGTSITVRVPNGLFKDWLTKHYSIVLTEALDEVQRSGVPLVFLAAGATPPVEPTPPSPPLRRQRQSKLNRARPASTHVTPSIRSS